MHVDCIVWYEYVLFATILNTKIIYDISSYTLYTTDINNRQFNQTIRDFSREMFKRLSNPCFYVLNPLATYPCYACGTCKSPNASFVITVILPRFFICKNYAIKFLSAIDPFHKQEPKSLNSYLIVLEPFYNKRYNL